MGKKDYLKNVFKPQNFSDEELALILQQFKQHEFSKNEYLIREGKIANYYYFVESGYIRSYAVDPEGNDVTTKFFIKNDIVIDWHSFFLKQPCKESIQAITDCVAWKVFFEDFMKLFHIESFREVGRTRLVNNYIELKQHTVSMITDQAKDRYLTLLEQKPGIIQNVPLKHIATYLGVTDTSLSRIRKNIFDNR